MSLNTSTGVRQWLNQAAMAKRGRNDWTLIGVGAALLGLWVYDEKKKAAAKREREAKGAAERAKSEAVRASENARRDADIALKSRNVRAFAERMLVAISKLFGVPTPPIYFGEDVNNFASDGRRILVNPRWALDVIEKHCNSQACNRDVLVWFLAHEMGHHVNGDSATPPLWIADEKRRLHAQELRADFFAGYALGRLGGELAHLDSVLREHAAIDTRTHPNHTLRLQAAREGFLAGQAHA